ncbi:MAG: mechanosensitive ion channel [Flavobacteriales bacterium]|nr:mechanosensitive ion channel [Flavobacteriales bacterium]MBL0036192.1 mechanosensitive ion channel [Flavobacteriales bacterium]
MRIKDVAMDYAPKLVAALLVLWVGSMLIKMFAKVMGKVLTSRGVEPTLQRFLHSLVTVSLRILLLVTFIGMLGVQTTSFIAIIGAAGLAVGLALQGTLANFAGGTLILLFKPYKVGDLVEAQGHVGHVKEIQIFTTVLLTPENKTVIIPNGAMANGNIVNYTREGKIRVDLTFGLNYASSVTKAREVLTGVMRAHPKVMPEPAPSVTVAKLNLDGVELAVRPHCDPKDYWDVYFDIYEQGLAALQANNIAGPQPTMRVYTTDKA